MSQILITILTTLTTGTKMATKKIHLNFLSNTYWEISEPVFFSKTFNLSFICMGNKFSADCETLHKDLYPSRLEQINYFASFLNNPHCQSLSESDYSILRDPKFELFLRSINGFVISVEAIPGGFGFYFYPHPISFNPGRETTIGRVKFVGTSFRVAENRLLISYRDCQTFEAKRISINISERELIALKRLICFSVLSYMRNNKKFVWNFELPSEVKSNLPFFD